MDRQVTPLRQVTSLTRGPPPPCKQALIVKQYYGSMSSGLRLCSH